MGNSIKYCLAIGIWLIAVCYLNARQNTIDSLVSVLKTAKADTDRVNTLNSITKLYWQTADFTQAKKYADKALELSDKINFKKGKAAALSNIGLVFWKQGNYPEALKNYFSALKIAEETGDKRKTAAIYTNIGNIYINQENYPEALKSQLPALDLAIKMGEKKLMANAYNSIATIYYRQGNFPGVKAALRDSLWKISLNNHFAALKLNEETGNKNWLAYNYNNIGILYEGQGEALRRENGNKDTIEKKFSEATKAYRDALKIEEEINDQDGLVGSCLNLGSVSTNLRKFSDAQKYLNKALAVSKEIGIMDDMKDSYLYLQKLDSMQRNFVSAYKNFKFYILYRDSLINEESTRKTVQAQMQYEFDKKEAATNAGNEKQAAIASAEKQRQRIVLILVSCVLLLVLVFAGFVSRSLRMTRRQKHYIEEQKQIVEEKQKEILDSIYYARRIQTALLPTEKYIDKTLNRLMKNN